MFCSAVMIQPLSLFFEVTAVFCERVRKAHCTVYFLKVKCCIALLAFILCFLGLSLCPAAAHSAESYLVDVEKLAQQGDHGAQFALGVLYEYGENEIKRDQEKSLYWLKKSGTEGVAGACLFLGIKYENGNGVEQDYSEAVRWYDCAARQDWPAAQFFLARLYREGKGVQKSFLMALAWFGLAAEYGYPGAEQAYAELLKSVDAVDMTAIKERQQCLLQGKKDCN